jgi:hypothetical protein
VTPKARLQLLKVAVAVFAVLAIYNGLRLIHELGFTALDTVFGPVLNVPPCDLRPAISQTPPPWSKAKLQGTFPNPWGPLVFPITAVVAAIAGRYVTGILSFMSSAGRRLAQRVPEPQVVPAAEGVRATRPEPMARWTDKVVQALLVGFLLGVGIGLVYESNGVLLNNDPWTITWVVACVTQSNTWATLLTLAAVSFVFGQWFLHSTRGTQDTTSGLTQREAE